MGIFNIIYSTQGSSGYFPSKQALQNLNSGPAASLSASIDIKPSESAPILSQISCTVL